MVLTFTFQLFEHSIPLFGGLALQLETLPLGRSDAQISRYDRNVLVAEATLRLQVPFRTVVLFLQGVIHLAQYV